VVAAHLSALGKPARAVDARQIVVTDDNHADARVDLDATRRRARRELLPLLEQGITPVVTGFIGATPDGITTTLGRGGSDVTAALLGALLGAREIWIWTDVDGILTADPRLVREARTLAQVSYREAAEMSYFGARVLHPKTIGPAVEAGIPIRIKNTFRPELPGTLVAETSPTLPQGVKTVSSVRGLALVTVEGRGMAGVPGVARRVFEAAEASGVNVVMISQASSEQSISFVVSGGETGRLLATLRQRFALELEAGAVDGIVAEPDVAVLSIVGQGMAGTPGISAKLFSALGAMKVNVLAIAQGASELNVSVAIKESSERRAVRAVHSAFGLTRLVNLMVLGSGTVGRALLDQLQDTHASIQRRLGLDLRLVGLANSSRVVLDDGGLAPADAPERLLGDGEASPGPGALLDRLMEGRFTDLVLVDLTAADTAGLHRAALERGVHVVTANKRPLSGAQAEFDALAAATQGSGARLNYETTFGAGLPVLHTLQELVNTGDRVLSVSGCFSGTLGFICTRLEQGAALADAVAEAREQGLTEPDPREDLSGRDVGRKALIIARTMGLSLEPHQISVEPLVPDLEAGLDQALEAHGAAMSQRAEQAAAEGEVLRYVAESSREGVWGGLRAVPRDGPLGSLRGQDNMLVYRTDRYSEFPLVIRGPGAGAAVTAAGVLGDVLKVARG